MRTLSLFILLFLTVPLIAGGNRSNSQPGDKVDVGIGLIAVPGDFVNPQFSFSAISRSGWGFYLAVGTQLLPGNSPAVALKHWSGEASLQHIVWGQHSVLGGYRYAADYPSAYAGEKPNQYHWGPYLGIRLVPLERLAFRNDRLALVASWWPTRIKTKVSPDLWEYSGKNRFTLAISYNITL